MIILTYPLSFPPAKPIDLYVVLLDVFAAADLAWRQRPYVVKERHRMSSHSMRINLSCLSQVKELEETLGQMQGTLWG